MVQGSATIAYVAAVANRFPHAANISPESLVAFGSNKFVSLWNLYDENIHATLPGHEGVVTCLRFVGESCFVSGDDKGVIRCWERSGSQVILTNLTCVNLLQVLPSGLRNKPYKHTRSRYLV